MVVVCIRIKVPHQIQDVWLSGAPGERDKAQRRHRDCLARAAHSKCAWSCLIGTEPSLGALLCGFVCHGFSRYLLLEDKISNQTLSTGFISLSEVHFTVAAFSDFLLRVLEEQNNKTEGESKKEKNIE